MKANKMRTIPALMTAAKIGGLIEKVGKTVTSLKEDLHMAGIQTLMHAQAHGDVTLCKRLLDTLDSEGDRTSVVRAEALKLWMGKMGPIVARQGVWSLKKGWNKDDFKIQEAMDVPFWQFSNDSARPNIVTPETLLNIVKGLLKRMDTAQSESRFLGDVSKTKATISNVIQLFEKDVAAMSPEERGQDDKTKQVILDAAKKVADGANQSVEQAA